MQLFNTTYTKDIENDTAKQPSTKHTQDEFKKVALQLQCDETSMRTYHIHHTGDVPIHTHAEWLDAFITRVQNELYKHKLPDTHVHDVLRTPHSLHPQFFVEVIDNEYPLLPVVELHDHEFDERIRKQTTQTTCFILQPVPETTASPFTVITGLCGLKHYNVP